MALTFIAVVVSFAGLSLAVDAVVFGVLAWREHERMRAQAEAFDYDEYRKAHAQKAPCEPPDACGTRARCEMHGEEDASCE